MIKEQPSNESPYRWYILSLGTLTHIFVLSMPYMAMPVLFKEISDDLHLSLVQIGTVWGMTGLASLFTAVLCGMLGDKYGTRLTLGLTCLLQGIAGALRGTAGDFVTLAVFCFIFGIVRVPSLFTCHKAAAEWFSGRQLGLANGILAMGVGTGYILATMLSANFLSPLLGGWRNVLYLYGLIALVIGILWLATGHNPSKTKSSPQSENRLSFTGSIRQVIRLKQVWLIAFTEMLYSAFIVGLSGYLPLYLRGKGWSGTMADATLAIMSTVSVFGVILLSLLSDKIGRRKLIFYTAICFMGIGTSIMICTGSSFIWLSVVLIGFVREAFASNMFTLMIETKGVGAVYSGSALGIMVSLDGLGGFFGPPIGNWLAEKNPTFTFVFWIMLIITAAIIMYFVIETGWRKSNYMEGQHH